MHTRSVTFEEIDAAALALADRWRPWTHVVGGPHYREEILGIYGIPRGGCVPAAIVARHLDLPLVGDGTLDRAHVLIVDDLVDSGGTLAPLNANGFRTDALFRKSWSPDYLAAGAHHLGDDWLHFPWELVTVAEEPEDNVRRILQFLGEDPTRNGLVDTPGRVIRALTEMTSGKDVDIEKLLGRVFDETCDEMVVVRAIEFTSLCEHHLLPFSGTATVAYIPTTAVVGLSKLARLVDAFAQRLQVQERMTEQIADAIEEHLAPKGVGVLVVARHSCMGCRGVKKPTAEMITSSLRGAMREDPRARSEFLSLQNS